MLHSWLRQLRDAPKFSWTSGILVGLMIVMFAWSLSQNGALAHRNCQQIEKLKATVRLVVLSSVHQLGRPGTAGFEYYRTHPLELAAAKRAAGAEANEFAPSSCH